jgi:pristinamycin I synthase-3/4
MEEILREDAPVPFDLSVEFNNCDGFLDVSFRYNIELFTKETIIQMATHYQNLLSEFLVKGDGPIAAAEMLSPTENKRLLGDWEHSRSDIPKTCIHELISRLVQKNPVAEAVICNGRSMTYLTLEKKSNQLAAYLKIKGVVPGSLVGILLPRSEDLLVTQLAILKAGGAYVFFDRDYPSERLVYMVQDSNPLLIVSHSSIYPKILENYQTIHLDDDSNEICSCPTDIHFPGTGQDAPIYVTYTSGSTGRPKGVMTLQRGVLNCIQFLTKEFHLSEGERVIQFTSLSFDPSFRDTLGVLTFGGTVILMDDDQMRDPEFITRTIMEQKIDCIMSIVPTMLRALPRTTAIKQTWKNQLRMIMASGDVLQPADVESVRNVFGPEVRIVNQYGPTECSMISTTYLVPEENLKNTREIPIGKQIDNVYFYILDSFRHLVPPGVKGELYIGGVGVSPGYLNQPQLTSERFIPDPFRPGRHIYRTGDLVRMAADGMLTFLGRPDHQVKIRGYRIELGEIETVISEYPKVQDAVVVLSQQDGTERLSAYITLSNMENDFSIEGLQQYIKERLPFYMLPSTITVLEKMPLTNTGKIDRQGLPKPKTGQDVDRYIAPRNETEKRLVSIWQEVIGVERVGVRDNYFELGGHSLMAVLLFTRIQEEFGKAIPMHLIFKDSTVESLAGYLSNESFSIG